MSARDDGGPAFPREDYQGDDAPGQRGMSLHDYAAIRFAAAWVVAISPRCDGMTADANIAIEANRLGLLQADHWIAQRAK